MITRSKTIDIATVALVSISLAICLTAAPAIAQDDNWIPDSAIVSGLGDIGGASAPTVFSKDGTWYLIAGDNGGCLNNGYKWNGSAWESDTAIVSGLEPEPGRPLKTHPTVFCMDGTWYLISGYYKGDNIYCPPEMFLGFYWNSKRSKWLPDSDIISGLRSDLEQTAPEVFNKDGTWYLISGEYNGNFYGFRWTGAAWENDTAIVSGLGDVGKYSTPAVFNQEGTWYLISGEGGYKQELFNGYRWTGSEWESVPAIVLGLSDVGTNLHSAPTVFYMNERWYLISGESYGRFYGFSLIKKPDLTPTAITAPPLLFENQPSTVNATIANVGILDASAFNVSLVASGSVVGTVNVPSLSVGNSTTVSFEWAPALGGDIELCVVADPGNAIVEMDEANNEKCIPVAVNASDLTPTAINVPPLIVNQASTINATIANVGVLDAAAFNVSLSANGSVVDTVSVPSLSVCESTNVSFGWIPALGGDQELCVVADPDNAIVEMDEANNKKCIVVTVSAIDLTPTAINVPSLFANQPGTINATIANAGTFDAFAFNVSLSVNGEVVDTASITSLSAGTSTTVSFEWTPELGGDHALCVIADQDNEITEIDEANNENCIVVTVRASDLTTTTITAPATLIVNHPSIITATIANEGTFDASAFNVSLSADGSIVSTVSVPSLSTETNTTVSFEWTPVSAGDLELCVLADSDDILTELDEANNEKCIFVTVNAPDLTPTAINVPELFVDQSSTINVTIANVGVLDAPAFNVSLVASGSVIGTAKVPSLNAGNSTNLSFEWTPTSADEPELCVVADAANEIAEMDETNNDKCIVVTVEDIVWHYSGLSMPWDAERLPNNNTLITEFGKHRVIELTVDKQIIWQFGTGTAGSDPDKLNCPVDAKRLPSGNTLITDSKNHRVFEVDSDKNIVWQYGNGTPGDGTNQLNYPTDAERLANGNTLITDEHNCRIIELRTSDYDTTKPDNNFTADSIIWQYGTTGVSGSGTNELNYPKDADRLSNGNTIIADYRNHRVIEVNAGEIIWQYGTGIAGSGINQLWYPTDAERISDNHTLIADHSNHRVIEVNEAKKRVWQYGTGVAGSGANELNNPGDAERLSNGNMLICDKDNYRVIEVVPGEIDVIPIAMETTPQELYAGLTLCEVTTSILNNGSAHSGRFNASLYADGIEVDTTTVDDIPAGGSANVTLEWIPTQVGDYNLTVIADSDDVIVETNERNNELTIEVSVLPTTVKRLTFDPYSSVNPNAVADSAGNLHLVWSDSRYEGTYYLYYKKLAPDGSVLVTDKRVCPGSGPKIAVDSSGNVHVAFINVTNSINVSYLKLDNNGNTLLTPKQSLDVSRFAGTLAYGIRTSVRGTAVDQEGNVHTIVFYDGMYSRGGCNKDGIIYAKLDNEGNELVNYTVDSIPYKPHYGTWSCIGMPSGIAVDSAGNAYTAYEKGLGACGGSGCDGFTCGWPKCARAYYVKIDSEGVHPPQELTGDLPLPSMHPSVCVDANDNKHVIWSNKVSEGYDFYYTKFDNSDTKVIDSKRLTYEDYPGAVSPIIDTESGVIYVAWSRDSEIYYMEFDTSGGMLINKTMISIAGGSSWEPCIDACPDGSHLVWTDNRDGNNEIYYAKTEAPPDRVFILCPADQWTPQSIVATYTIGILSTMSNAETFNLAIEKLDPVDVAELSDLAITLEPYSIGEVTLNVTDSGVGDYRVTVTATSQSNPEIQDSATITTSVVVPTPDLIVTAMDAYHNDTGYSPYFNLSNEVDVKVKNIGTSDAGTFNVCLYADTTLVDTQSVSDLGIGMSETVQLKWTPSGMDCEDGGSPQTYTLKAIADCGDVIVESDETNNEGTAEETAYWAGYSADEHINAVAWHGVLRGGLNYTTGDGSYTGLYSPGSSVDTHYSITLPSGASVELARLNVYYTWSKDYSTGVYPVMEVSITNTSGTYVVPINASYNDRPCDSPAISFEYPFGNYVFDLKPYITGDGSYTVTVENVGTKGHSFCIAAPGVVILYKDSSKPEREFWILEGADLLEGGRRGGAGNLALSECISNATFAGSIDTGRVETATLGIVSAWGGDSWGDHTSHYWFNDNYLGDGSILGGYHSVYDRTVNGMSMHVANAQVGANVSDVTGYLTGQDNTASFGDDGDSMMAANAFLVVEYDEPCREEKPEPAVLVPFMISGSVTNYSDGTPINNPGVTIKNMNTGEPLPDVETHDNSSYYQVLTSLDKVSCGDVLQFTCNGTTLTHTVGQREMDMGGFDLDIAVEMMPEPDLTVTEKNETLLEDGTFTVNYTVANIGGGDAGASSTTIYIDGVNVLEDTVPALTAGASYTNTVGPFNCPCGQTLNVTVCADNNEVVDESDEGNNCLTNEFACPPCPEPDLNITDKFETLLGDGNFTVNYTVKNIGGGDAGASNTTIYIDGVNVLEDTVPALAAGASYTNTVGPFDCPCGQTLNVTVCADSNGVVNESDEGNNCLTNGFACPPCLEPDLNITDKLETLLEDGNFTVNYTVKNIGGGDAGASNTTIYIDGVNVLEDTVPALAAGASYTNIVGPFDCSCGQALNVTVCADSNGVVDESDEGNNCLSNEFACPPCPEPDLNITDKLETLLEDGNFTVNYTVKNIGGGDAGVSNTTIYIDGVNILEDTVPALAAGDNYTSTVGPFECPCGQTLNVTVCADNNGVVDESDEGNNCLTNELVCPVCTEFIEAGVTFDKKKIDLNSSGILKAFITLPDSYDVANISVSTVTCEGAPIIGSKITGRNVLEAKFNIQNLTVPTGPEVLLTVTGELYDGTPFEGSNTVEVV